MVTKTRAPLDELFFRQGEYVDLLIKKGKQKQFPLPLDDRDNQKFIKGLFSYLEEELFEAFELLELTNRKITMEGPSQDPQELKDYLVDFNHEMADTLCFWVEIFQYVNITEDVIYEYYSILLEKLDQMRLLKQEDILQTALNYAESILQQSRRIDKRRIHITSYDIIKYNPKILELKLPEEFMYGGSHLSHSIVELCEYYIFHSLKHLNIARNCLKMKYWRDGGDGVNYDKFHNSIMEAFLYYTVFLYSVGLDNSKNIVNVYMQKQKINIERVQTGW